MSADLADSLSSLSLKGAAPAASWYYIDEKQNYVGPVDTDGLRQLLAHAYVSHDTYVWAAHLSGWLRLADVPDFVATPRGTNILPRSTQPPPSAPSPPAAAEPASAPATATATATATAAPANGVDRIASAEHAARGSPAPPTLGLRRRQQPAATPLSPAAGAARPPTKPPVPPVPLGQSLAAKPPQPDPASAAEDAAASSTPSRPARQSSTARQVSEFQRASPREEEAASLTPRAAVPRMEGAPEAEGAWDEGDGLRVLTAGGLVRAVVLPDGEVRDGTGRTLAYIEANGEVGSHEMEFLGRVHRTAGTVCNRRDEHVGEVDIGHGYVRNAQGSVVAEVSKDGSVSGNGQRTAGYVQGFTFEAMPRLAAYVLLVDPAFVAGF